MAAVPFCRRFRVYDHTVFVTYSLCFMTLLLIAGSAAGAGLADASPRLLFFVPPFHMYRQLKGAYQLGTMRARCGGRSRWSIFAFAAIGMFTA